MRRLSFNVGALKQVAASACGAQSVLSMKKLGEGCFNKAFLLLLDNGAEVSARIPTPNASPVDPITASEVATMDFVRTRLGVPAPEVYTWSSDPEANPVGAAYVLMEKAPGIALDAVWPDMPSSLKDEVVRAWVDVEKRLTVHLFGGCGSIFYSDNPLPTSTPFSAEGGRDNRFVLGPVMTQRFWGEGKHRLDVNRGPCEYNVPACSSNTDVRPVQSPMDYMLALSRQEREWLKAFATPAAEHGPFDPPAEVQRPELHLQLLDKFDAIARYLIPDDPVLLRPVLLHPDVHAGNIFISKKAYDAGRIEITSIIDWQHAAILPAFHTARVPQFLHHVETHANVKIDAMYDANQEAERARRHQLYMDLAREHNPEYYKALTWEHRDLVLPILGYVFKTWDDGYVPLKYFLYRYHRSWNKSAKRKGDPCPIGFSEEEIGELKRQADEWQERQDMLEQVKTLLGVDRTGEVAPEQYEAKLKLNEELRVGLAQSLEREVPKDLAYRTWPWRP